MKKYIFSMVLGLSSLFAQEAREEMGRSIQPPQTPAQKYAQKNIRSIQRLEKRAKITGPSGEVFYAHFVDGRYQMNPQDRARLESDVDMPHPDDVVTVEANGIITSYVVSPWWDHCCCFFDACGGCGEPTERDFATLLDGRSITLDFSTGGRAMVSIKNRRVVIDARSKSIIQNARDKMQGELTITFPDRGVVINAPVSYFYDEDCEDDPVWCWIKNLVLFWMQSS